MVPEVTLPFERPVLETPEHPAQELPCFAGEGRRRAGRASRSYALPLSLAKGMQSDAR